MIGIKLILDETIDDGALSYTLISNKNDFKLDCMFFMSGIAKLLLIFARHCL